MNRLNKTAWALIAAGVSIIGIADSWVAADRPQPALELEISQSTANSLFQVFFDTSHGYQGPESVTRPIAASNETQRLVFPLPDQPVRAMRLDPLTTTGSVVVASAKIGLSPSTQAGTPLDLKRVAPLYDIQRLAVQANTGALEITTVPRAIDPQCQIVFDQPVAVSREPIWNLWLAWLPLDASILFIYVLLAGLLWLATGQSPVEWWHSMRGKAPAFRQAYAKAIPWVAAPLVIYVWLLVIPFGRMPLLPEQEPSWVAVGTYAIAQKWQFGKDIVFTYGPMMPLMICTFIGSIDTAVFIGRLLCASCTLVLMLWLGLRLSLSRRWFFWVAAVTLATGFLEQPFYYLSIVSAGLLFARPNRFDRWLFVPTMIYVAALALAKVSFLVYAALMLATVACERARRRQWLGAVTPAFFFAVCFLVEWWLLGQHLVNLPPYLRASLELTNGFSQAMSAPPAPGILPPALLMAAAAGLQLGFLFAAGRRPRWENLPMTGLLAGGLLLAWKAGFTRADGHVADWLIYAMVSAAAAPAFFPPLSQARRLLPDHICLIVVFLAGSLDLGRLNPETNVEWSAMFRERWRGNLHAVLHPREAAQSERQSVRQNRLLYALPQVQGLVGRSTVDVFCDEGAIAILNNLNYKPRPSFLSYSTYTPWLTNVNLAYYCSPQAPAYVLFKLQSIDNRLPTLQNASLLLLIAEFYEPALTENGYVLFRRREQPKATGLPAAFPLLAQGDFPLSDALPLPKEGAVWCELEMRETLAGKLLKTFYQQPPLNMRVTFEDGTLREQRLIPTMAASGFLINPLPSTEAEFLDWIAGRPFKAVRSLQVVSSDPADTQEFAPMAHYKFYRVPIPASSAAATSP